LGYVLVVETMALLRNWFHYLPNSLKWCKITAFTWFKVIQGHHFR